MMKTTRWHLVKASFDSRGVHLLVEAGKSKTAIARVRAEVFGLGLRSPEEKRNEPPPEWLRRLLGNYAVARSDCNCSECNPSLDSLRDLLTRYTSFAVLESGDSLETATLTLRGVIRAYLDPSGNSVDRSEAFRRYRRLRPGYRVGVKGAPAYDLPSAIARWHIELMPLPPKAVAQKRPGFQVPLPEAPKHEDLWAHLGDGAVSYHRSWDDAVRALGTSYVITR
jgi:hypothetical protein